MSDAEATFARRPMTYDECVTHHEDHHRSDLPIEECDRVVCKIYVKRKSEEKTDARED